MSTWEQIGNVEILRFRVYPIDPRADWASLVTEVGVEPGTYPVYRKFDAICWIMSGRINERHEKIGDGLFALHEDDSHSGLAVSFLSRTYGIEEFREFLTDPLCQDGVAQRLRFNVQLETDAV